jgi:hypothetical protein
LGAGRAIFPIFFASAHLFNSFSTKRPASVEQGSVAKPAGSAGFREKAPFV